MHPGNMPATTTLQHYCAIFAMTFGNFWNEIRWWRRCAWRVLEVCIIIVFSRLRQNKKWRCKGENGKGKGKGKEPLRWRRHGTTKHGQGAAMMSICKDPGALRS